MTADSGFVHREEPWCRHGSFSFAFGSTNKQHPSRKPKSISAMESTQPSSNESASNKPQYDLTSAKILVETSMLASVSGVCQLVFSILKLDSYLYYLLPFPLVLSALRSGPSASRKTLYATFFLTLVLLGFPRAVSYLLLYGFLGFTLGTLWHQGSPWWLTWPVCTMSYVAGMFSYIYVASFFLKENLFKLVTYNVHTTLTKVATLCGFQVSPPSSVIVMALLFFLVLRGLMYTYILQFCYALLLNSMGYPSGPMPRFIERLIETRYRENYKTL